MIGLLYLLKNGHLTENDLMTGICVDLLAVIYVVASGDIVRILF